jgi:hypothetical protein
MKKILFLFLIGGAFLMASCTKQYNTVIPNQTTYKDIVSTDWITTDGGFNYTTAIAPAPGGDFGLSSDAVLVYFTFDGGKTYEEVPEVYNNVSYTYTVTNGEVVLYAQSADGTQTVPVPPALTAKIIVVPSN